MVTAPAIPESPRPPVLAVIVNYRTPALAIEALRSVAGEIPAVPGARAVVVDNASGDGSAAAIAAAIRGEGWSGWAALLEAPSNGGFSAGNNAGIAHAAADAYLLLNSDAMLRPGALAELLGALRERPDAGIVGPRLEWPDGTPQVSCFRQATPLSELIHAAGTRPLTRALARHDLPLGVPDAPTEAGWVSFACALILAEALGRVGTMDEGYFMYYEDIDYCRRIREAGWRVLHWPAARAVHLRGGSASVKADTTARRRLPRYFYESRSRYFAKFYGRAGLCAANALWTAGRGIAVARELLEGRPRHTPRRAIMDNWTNCLDPLRGRAARGAGGRTA